MIDSEYIHTPLVSSLVSDQPIGELVCETAVPLTSILTRSRSRKFVTPSSSKQNRDGLNDSTNSKRRASETASLAAVGRRLAERKKLMDKM